MFNLKRYEDLIKSLVNAGLKPTTNWNEKLSSNSLLIRHDVDFSIEYAHRLALFESQLKICSTFFFMLSSNLYNSLSAHNQKLIKDISGMNHKVSIHFDHTVYENLEYFKYEKNIFENIFGKKVDIVSVHRPKDFLNNKITGSLDYYKRTSDKLLLDNLYKMGVNIKQVVCISSGASQNTYKGWGGYSISKAALRMMMKVYSKDILETHFTSLAPGLVDTQMQKHLCNDVDITEFPETSKFIESRDKGITRSSDEVAKDVVKTIPDLLDLESGSYIDLRME